MYKKIRRKCDPLKKWMYPIRINLAQLLIIPVGLSSSYAGVCRGEYRNIQYLSIIRLYTLQIEKII